MEKLCNLLSCLPSAVIIATSNYWPFFESKAQTDWPRGGQQEYKGVPKTAFCWILDGDPHLLKLWKAGSCSLPDPEPGAALCSVGGFLLPSTTRGALVVHTRARGGRVTPNKTGGGASVGKVSRVRDAGGVSSAGGCPFPGAARPFLAHSPQQSAIV